MAKGSEERTEVHLNSGEKLFGVAITRWSLLCRMGQRFWSYGGSYLLFFKPTRKQRKIVAFEEKRARLSSSV